MKRSFSMVLSLLMVIWLFPTAALDPVNAYADLAPARFGERPIEVASSQGEITDVVQVLSKTLGTKARSVPAAQDFHEAFGIDEAYGYPVYNVNYDTSVAHKGGDASTLKAAVLAEDEALLDYTSLDADGNLYKDGVLKTSSSDGRTVTKLVRHTTGVHNYGESIPDDALSTTKRLSLRMVRYGNVLTGLYAPPGEVVKVTLNSASSDTPAKDLGLQAFIGNFGGNAERVEIPSTKNYVRMPKAEKTLSLDSEVNYIGSPFGGAILIYSNGIGGTTVDLTIEGAVEMPTYFYGQTSDEEFARQLQTPGPYFAFSTPRGLRAVGPASLVRGKSVEQLKRAMQFWDKAIGLSYQFEAGSFDSSNPDTNMMVEMFEPYIPAGAAVNMGNYCICPVDWGTSFLDGDGLVTSGAWGQIHELNHSFPWGGAIDGMTEISNNVINALTYQLYTNIAANRKEPTNRSDPSSGGLSGWNWTSDMYTTVERLRLNNEAAAAGSADLYPRWNLVVYVPLQHAYGPDRFLNAVHLYHEKGGKYNRKLSGNALYTNSNVWMRAASEASGYDLGYYMRDVQGFPEYLSEQTDKTDYITTDVRTALADTGPVYIPSGCLYASGFAYDANGEGTATGAVASVNGRAAVSAASFESGKDIVEMGRPFRIPAGAAKTLDFNASTDGGYVSVACGENVEMVGYTSPRYGSLASTANALKLRYTPDATHLEDYFYVTLKLTVTDADSPYAGVSQNVTYKVSLMQETGGFTTSCYTWSNPSNVARNAAVAYAVEHGALDQEPASVASSSVAGFDSAVSGTLAVTEGKVFIPKTGAVDLYVRGNYWFNTCVSASADGLPSAANAQSKRDWPIGGDGSKYDITAKTSKISVYVVPSGEGVPADASAYAAVIEEGGPLYVRAYELVNGGAGRFRIGYLDGDAVSEFASSEVLNMNASQSVTTPSIASFEREKLYSYPDPAVQNTRLTGEYVSVGAPLSPIGAWKLEGDAPLSERTVLGSYGNTPLSNAVDGNYATHFHGTATSAMYEAEFVFELGDGAQATPFNIIKYMGHADFGDRGKVKDYEVYVGDDLTALREATTASPLLVAQGTANQSPDETLVNPDNSSKKIYNNYIELGKKVSGKYVRLVARSAYLSNTQYYYAFTEFDVGKLDSISGEGVIEEDYDTQGSWQVDDAFVNTRTDLMTTTSGRGTFAFKGSGVIMYAAKGPGYGTMMVELDDGEPVEASELAPTLRGQQPIFWKSGLDSSVTHTVTFWPKTSGADKVNVEYFEVKTAEYSVDDDVDEEIAKELSIQLDSTRFTYTGSPIIPAAHVYLGDEDVTSSCAITYDANENVGTASVTASLSKDGKDYTASESFEILKATYPGTVTVSLSGGETGYTYNQPQAIPVPQASGAPAGATVTYYYSATDPGDLSSEAGGSGLSDGAYAGTLWSSSAMTSTSLSPDTYYLWALVSSPNYSDLVTAPISFTVSPEIHVHSWGEPTYTWSDDNAKVTARVVCQLEDSHVLTETAASTYEVVTAPTTIAQGKGSYTAEFEQSPFATQVKTVVLDKLTLAPIKVTFNAEGGTVSAASMEVYEGSPYGALPDATREGWIFEGWFTSSEGGSQVTSATVVSATADHELHAHWAPTATVDGKVLSGTISSGGVPVKDARVELKRGNTVIQSFVTEEDGSYEFPLVAYDVYNVVVRTGSGLSEQTVTTMISVADSTVVDSAMTVADLVLPADATGSVLEVSENAPDVVVGGLDSLATSTRFAAESAASADEIVSVVVKMVVTGLDEWEAVGAPALRELAESASGSLNVEMGYLDIAIEQTVTKNASGSLVSTTATLSQTAQVITIAIPFDLDGKNEVSLYRYHGGNAALCQRLASKPDAPVGGTYFIDADAGIAYLYADEFSTYAWGYTVDEQEDHVHEWGDWTTTVAPICTEPGQETRVCALDATHVETRDLAALGHDWGDWQVVTPATASAEGEEQRVCSRDASHVETRSIATLEDEGDHPEASQLSDSTPGDPESTLASEPSSSSSPSSESAGDASEAAADSDSHKGSTSSSTTPITGDSVLKIALVAVGIALAAALVCLSVVIRRRLR